MPITNPYSIEPRNDNILVREIDETDEQGEILPVKRGLLRPDLAKTDTGQPLGYVRRCEVVGIGPGVDDIPPGCTVLVRSRVGAAVPIDHDKAGEGDKLMWFLVEQEDVLAVEGPG